jgi:hypothetical protein
MLHYESDSSRYPAHPLEQPNTSHAEGNQLEVLADLASHQYDDLAKYSTGRQPSTQGTCSSDVFDVSCRGQLGSIEID